MRKLIRYILLLTFFSMPLFAQGVELPDFVITGVQSVDLPTMEKSRPEIVSTVSKEFFTPVYSPEEFSLSSISGPEIPDIVNFNRSLTYDGFVKGGFGGFTIPLGEVFLSKSFDHVDLSFNAFGRNEKDFVENSDNRMLGGRFDSDFFISTRSSFLPGLNISLDGGYLSNVYKLYGSPNPALERKFNTGFAELEFKNLLESNLRYGTNFHAEATNLNVNSFGESVFSNKSFVEFKLLSLHVKADGFFSLQSLTNNISQIKDYNYFGFNGSAKISFSKAADLEGGIHFSKLDGNKIFAPFGIANIYFSDFITFTAKYKPHSSFFSAKDILEENKYYNLSQIDNVFMIYKHHGSAVLKYQYQKYYEINIGGSYSYINNYFHFNDPARNSSFDLFILDDVKKLELFGSARFHLGPFGWFYGEAVYQKLEQNNLDVIPYVPAIESNIIYGYPFKFGLEIHTQLDLNFDTYTDTNKIEKLPLYLNLSAGAKFKLFDNFKLTFDFENILNRDNFKLRNYQNKSLDVIFGIDYSW